MTRTVEIRYQILRNGAEYCELHAVEESAPLLQMNETDEIKISLSGDFIEDPRINWLTDEIRPRLIIDGVTSPLGVYLPATVTPSEDESTKSVRVEAFDRCWRVRDNYTETLLYFPAGSLYVEVVKQLLAACGISIVIATPSTATLSESREDWEIGTSYLTIINDLLSEINYNQLWFNADGAAVLEPAAVPSALNIKHILDDNDVRSLLFPRIERTTDIYNAPNVFICICSNADKSAPMVATAENNNPQSPLSIQRRGRRIVSVEHINNIASQAELQAYTDRRRNESIITGEQITAYTALLPGFGVGDVTALHYGDLSTVCIERAWSMELCVGGEMKHDLERVVIALG